jgi:hypothetical protein
MALAAIGLQFRGLTANRGGYPDALIIRRFEAIESDRVVHAGVSRNTRPVSRAAYGNYRSRFSAQSVTLLSHST